MNTHFRLVYLLAKPLCLLSIFLLSANAFAQKAMIDSSKVRTLRINPDDAHGAKVSEVFDKVKFIPLETTKESLFGRIYHLRLLKGHFVIYDRDTKAVLVFSPEGKFRSKITVNELLGTENDGDVAQILQFEFARYKADSVISIQSKKYCHYFNLDGKRIAKVAPSNIPSDDFVLDNRSRASTAFEPVKNEDLYYELAILGKSDTVAYFPYKRTDRPDQQDYPDLFDYRVPGELFFRRPHGFDLYKVSASRLSLDYRLVFPEANTLPKDFATNPIFNGKKIQFFQNNPKKFFRLDFAYLIGDNLFLQMTCFAPESEVKGNFIYNLKTSDIISIGDLEPDKLSNFLPVNDLGKYFDFSNYGFHFLQDSNLYTSYSSLAMFDYKEQLGDKQKDFGPLLNEYFKTQNRKSNPVIIQLKPKRN